MASRRAEGRVGGARDRRPSIRHRLSLFRKTWPPSRAGQEDRPGSVLGAPPAAGSARPVPGGARALTHGPGWAHLGRWGRGWEVQVSQARRLWDGRPAPSPTLCRGLRGAQPPEGERGASRPAAGPLGCQPRTPPPPAELCLGWGTSAPRDLMRPPLHSAGWAASPGPLGSRAQCRWPSRGRRVACDGHGDTGRPSRRVRVLWGQVRALRGHPQACGACVADPGGTSCWKLTQSGGTSTAFSSSMTSAIFAGKILQA